MEITDGDKNTIGEAKVLKILNNYIEVVDNEEKMVCSFSSSNYFGLLKNNWEVEVVSKQIDKRLIVFIPSIIYEEDKDTDE